MARFVFPFTKLRMEDGSHMKESKIPVTIIGKDGALEMMAVLDTGSTVSYLPLEIAEALGFEKSKAKTQATDGIGGKEKIGEFEITLKIARKNQSKVLSNMPIYVFMDPKTKYFILGLEPFFSSFDITFRLGESKIELKETGARIRKY